AQKMLGWLKEDSDQDAPGQDGNPNRKALAPQLRRWAERKEATEAQIQSLAAQLAENERSLEGYRQRHAELTRLFKDLKPLTDRTDQVVAEAQQAQAQLGLVEQVLEGEAPEFTVVSPAAPPRQPVSSGVKKVAALTAGLSLLLLLALTAGRDL